MQTYLPTIFKNLQNEEIMMLRTAYDLIRQSSNIQTYNCKRMIIRESCGTINYFYPFAKLLLLHSIEITYFGEVDNQEEDHFEGNTGKLSF